MHTILHAWIWALIVAMFVVTIKLTIELYKTLKEDECKN